MLSIIILIGTGLIAGQDAGLDPGKMIAIAAIDMYILCGLDKFLS